MLLLCYLDFMIMIMSTGDCSQELELNLGKILEWSELDYIGTWYSHKYQPRHKLSVNCEQDCGLASSAT